MHDIQDQTRIACATHGARAVSEAAYAAMTGRRAALDAVGLGDAKGIGALHEITVIAFGLMGAADRAADLTQATIDGARIQRRD